MIPAFPKARHSIKYLNDGWYGNCRSWIPQDLPATAEIDLSRDFLVSYVALGSESKPQFGDRPLVDFTIEIATDKDPNRWVTVYPTNLNEPRIPVTGRREFRFSEQPVRFVCMSIQKPQSRIDEIEVYGKFSP